MIFTQVTPSEVKTPLNNGTTVYYLNPDKEIVSNLMNYTQRALLNMLSDETAVFFTAQDETPLSDPLNL